MNTRLRNPAAARTEICLLFCSCFYLYIPIYSFVFKHTTYILNIVMNFVNNNNNNNNNSNNNKHITKIISI